MNSNGLLQKHWLQVSLHFLLDVALAIGSCLLAAFVVFSIPEARQTPQEVIGTHWLAFAMTGAGFGCCVYVAGLYASHGLNRGAYRRIFTLGCCVVFSAILLVGLTYASTARPLGRGYMLVAMGVHALLALGHHGYLLYAVKTARERVAYIVTNSFDEGETHIFTEIGLNHLDFIGVIAALGYQPTGKLPLLGRANDMAGIVKRERIDRILVTGKALNHATLCKEFCQLRYSGVTVMPLVILCEEVDQYVPLELVSPEWLLNASGEPHLLYIRKIKRLFDVVVSAVGLVLALPLLFVAMLAVKLTSRGPVFFRQTRSGRFGKPFAMIKLRTMRVDAEKAGAQWAQGGSNGCRDPRVTFVGGMMRRFRIDEIPQLWNVLKGDMSFVGPRPERPEMISSLATTIPYYEERMMVQPGITGWAQVNYPYGASIVDARHKLEYDLYYLKNMGLFLDVFILLDTVRTVIFGGAKSRVRRVEVSGPKIEELKAKESKVEPVLGTA